MIHVDDVLVASGIEDWTWFSEMVRKQLTMNAEGPFEYGSNNTFYYLKKKVVLARQGIFVQPNPSYIKKMVELLELHGKKTKTLPHHSNLEVYDKGNIKERERLNAEDQRMFRSGLGLALYIAQDRPDIQQSLKTLSTYMAGGTKLAYTALRHLGSYLQGTQDAGVLLTQLKRFGVTSDHWDFPEWSNREDRKNYNLEVFTDANWAGCKVSRKSTTSYMVFLNGSLLVSSCKLQSSIALSSAESELYASCSGIAEMLHVGSRLKFLVGANEVQMTAFSDSSAARGIMQRAGQGKLKHIHILWTQDLVREKIVRLLRVPTAINPADLNTKKLAQERRKKLMSLMPMGNQNGVEIETIETIPREVTQKTIQKILRVILAGSTCFLQGCTNLTVQSGEMTVNDIITIRNLVILALTLVILYQTNNEELERIVPSRPEVFSWYREQLLLIGEGVETQLTIAARELSHFINTILDEAMNRRGRVFNGDMMGRLFTLRNEMTAAIEDCQTPEGYRRSILFAKRLQRLEREEIQRGADAAAAGHPDEEEAEAARQEFIRQHTSGEERELGNQDDNNALLQYLPPEADAIDDDVTMEYVDVDDINVIEIGDTRGNDSRQTAREQQAVIHLSDGEEEEHEDPRNESNDENQQPEEGELRAMERHFNL